MSHFRSHAIEFADSGVRVNCIAPGIIFSQTARDNYAFDVFNAAKPGIPAKRLGTPEEVILSSNILPKRLSKYYIRLSLWCVKCNNIPLHILSLKPA